MPHPSTSQQSNDQDSFHHHSTVQLTNNHHARRLDNHPFFSSKNLSSMAIKQLEDLKVLMELCDDDSDFCGDGMKKEMILKQIESVLVNKRKYPNTTTIEACSSQSEDEDTGSDSSNQTELGEEDEYISTVEVNIYNDDFKFRSNNEYKNLDFIDLNDMVCKIKRPEIYWNYSRTYLEDAKIPESTFEHFEMSLKSDKSISSIFRVKALIKFIGKNIELKPISQFIKLNCLFCDFVDSCNFIADLSIPLIHCRNCKHIISEPEAFKFNLMFGIGNCNKINSQPVGLQASQESEYEESITFKVILGSEASTIFSIDPYLALLVKEEELKFENILKMLELKKLNKESLEWVLERIDDSHIRVIDVRPATA